MRVGRKRMCIHGVKPRFVVPFAIWCFVAPAFGHVRMLPNESAPGATERYSMRVPTERQSPTVRVQIEFPAAVTLVSIEETPGWKIEQKKDAQGKTNGAVWSGGSIPFAEYVDFHFNARNPATDTKIEWKVIQIYEDGTRSEWTGPENSRTPSPVTIVRKDPARP
jgi:uncharacterized protein YcnI